MVVSNKKLKQRVRSLFVDYLAAKESSKDGSKSREMTEQLDSLKEIIRSNRKRRPKPPRTRVPKNAKNSQSLEGEEGNEVAEESKKRKRGDGDGDGDGGEEKKGKNRWENKKRKKKLKDRKRKEKMKEMENVGLEGGKQIVSGDGDEKISVQPLKVEEREETVDFSRKVFVGGIPYYSSEEDIRSFFDSCGTLTELDCMTFPETGKFRGIAFLSFKTEAAAKRALALDGADMGGFYLKIQPYNKSSRSATKSEKADFAPDVVEGYNRIYAGNLLWDITEDDLRKFLSDCKISSIHFGEDKETGEFKGYAHINFKDSVSLAMALKLDQNVVCGRPVRIRCAVPLAKEKGAANSFPKNDGNENGVGFGSKLDEQVSAFEDNGNEEYSILKPESNNVSDETTVQGASKGKNKRRTCYECGVPGHLSSACPQKKTAEVSENGACMISNKVYLNEKSNAYEDNGNNGAMISKPDSNMSVAVPNASKGKKNKRRTCYECGVPGHLSSECSQKKTVDSKSEEQGNAIEGNENGINLISEQGKGGTSEPPTPSAAGKGKKNKRRTCYECGIPGHLSSECPQKKTVKPKSDEEQGNAKEGRENGVDLVSKQEKGSSISEPTAPPSAGKGKNKRRTCYECGVAGHLSAACPEKKTATAAALGLSQFSIASHS